MRIRLLFGILFLLSSCREPPDLTIFNESSVGAEIDTTPPKIKWISPRFDEVVSELVIVKCQVTDKSGISRIELWADSLQSGMDSTAGADSIYTITWNLMNFNNGEIINTFFSLVNNFLIKLPSNNDTNFQNIINRFINIIFFTKLCLIPILYKKFFKVFL